jgi:hypothetical protein
MSDESTRSGHPMSLLERYLGVEEAARFRADRHIREEREAARYRAAASLPRPERTWDTAIACGVTASDIAAAIRRDPEAVRQVLLDLLVNDLAVLIAQLTGSEPPTGD